MELDKYLKKMGYEIKEMPGAGNLILKEGIKPKEEEEECIKIYVGAKNPRDKENVKELVIKLITTLKKYINHGEIFLKYSFNPTLGFRGISSGDLIGTLLFGGGYNVCIYIPYEKEIFRGVFKKIIELGESSETLGSVKLAFGKSYFHEYIRLGDEDLKSIERYFLDRLKSKIHEVEGEIEDIKERMKNPEELISIYTPSLRNYIREKYPNLWHKGLEGVINISKKVIELRSSHGELERIELTDEDITEIIKISREEAEEELRNLEEMRGTLIKMKKGTEEEGLEYLVEQREILAKFIKEARCLEFVRKEDGRYVLKRKSDEDATYFEELIEIISKKEERNIKGRYFLTLSCLPSKRRVAKEFLDRKFLKEIFSKKD